MKTKHTPGPWTLSGQNFFIQKHKGDRQIESIAEVYATANARLINAAPEMLEALVRALKYLKDPGDVNSRFTVYALEAAIAKATGGAE